MSFISRQAKESSSSDQDSLSASDTSSSLQTEKQRRRGFRRFRSMSMKMVLNNSDSSINTEGSALPPPPAVAEAPAASSPISPSPKKSRVSTARSADTSNETVSFLKSSRRKPPRPTGSKNGRRGGRIRGLFGAKRRKSNPWETAEATSAGLLEQLRLETSSELFQLEKEDIEFHYRIENNFLNAFL